MFALALGRDEGSRMREFDVLSENRHGDAEAEHAAIVRTFRLSKAYKMYLAFVTDLSESVKGRPNSSASPEEKRSGAIRGLLALLEEVDGLVTATPPLEGPSRFGNVAFRDFLGKLKERAAAATLLLLPSELAGREKAAEEAARYLTGSFGDERRIDYGTGHELNFACFLLCLHSLGVLPPEDFADAVLLVFNRYMAVCRRLQSTYLLEPAGSRGVWGLDDFHFLPFYFGAAQLIGHKHMRPKSVRYQDVFDYYSKDYMYLAAIKWIHNTKLSSFAEHSPMLNDITAVRTWEKVNSGLLKMYKAETLSKFAVIQHFIYTSLLPADADPDALRAEEEAEAAAAAAAAQHDHSSCSSDGCSTAPGHGHAHGARAMPCCSDVIRFPSVMAAARAGEGAPKEELSVITRQADVTAAATAMEKKEQ